jgi:hypothetical protein
MCEKSIASEINISEETCLCIIRYFVDISFAFFPMYYTMCFSYVEWYPGEMFRMPSDWDCVFPSISSKPRSQTPPQKEKIGIASLMATPWARSHKDLSKSGWWLKNNLEKYDFVNGKDDIPYMKWKNHPNVPNHQLVFHMFLWFSQICTSFSSNFETQIDAHPGRWWPACHCVIAMGNIGLTTSK